MRDDFSQRTKDLLANRVGWKCSNPNCRKATRGAGIGKENIINIGVASHITAASKGGPRYDENITSQERASAEGVEVACIFVGIPKLSAQIGASKVWAPISPIAPVP